jgi:cysteine desulfurase
MSRLGVLLWRNLRAAGGLSRRLHDSVGRTAPPALPLERSEVSESSNHGARPLYMDVQATTPMDPRVLDTMLPYLTSLYGNPHSRTHAYGWEAEEAVEAARKQVADLIGADPREIVFTSGATESNNMAIKGVARFYKAKKSHVITTQIEHKCVLDSCRALESEGMDITYLPVGTNGIINLEELESAMRPETSLVSVMTVNNEIGVRQPVEEIGLFRTLSLATCVYTWLGFQVRCVAPEKSSFTLMLLRLWGRFQWM